MTLSLRQNAANFRGTSARQLVVQGMKYNHVGSRTGNASILDSDILRHNVENQVRNLKGHYRVGYFDDAGNPIPNPTIEVNGRTFTSRGNGDNTIIHIDKEAMDTKLRRQEEANEYVNNIVKYCIYDDDLAMDALSLNRGEYDKLLSGPVPEGMPTSLQEYDGRASALDATAPDSKAYSGGIARLRFVIKHFATPVIDENTGTKALLNRDTQYTREAILPAPAAPAAA